MMMMLSLKQDISRWFGGPVLSRHHAFGARKLTKQSQLEYSTALDGKGEVGAVKDGDKIII